MSTLLVASALCLHLQCIGPSSLMFIRNLLDKLATNQQNILKFIACNEIFLMPATVFMLFRWERTSVFTYSVSRILCFLPICAHGQMLLLLNYWLCSWMYSSKKIIWLILTLLKEIRQIRSNTDWVLELNSPWRDINVNMWWMGIDCMKYYRFLL